MYSLHKESTSAYIQKYVKENHPGLEAELLHKISFDLPSTYKFHKKSKRKISLTNFIENAITEVVLVRVDKRGLLS